MPQRPWDGSIIRECDPDVDKRRRAAANESTVAHLGIRFRPHDALVQVAARVTDERRRLQFAEHLDALQKSGTRASHIRRQHFVSQVSLSVATAERRGGDANSYILSLPEVPAPQQLP